MLSLSKTINELDRLEALRRDAVGAFAEAIRASAAGLVELDPARLLRTEQSILALASSVEQADAASVEGVPSDLRQVLAGYKSVCDQEVADLRGAVQQSTRMLREVLTSVSGQGLDHHQALERDLQELKALQDVQDLQVIHATIAASTERMSAHIEQMKKETELLVAQLRDEIRTLQRELEQDRSRPAASPEPAVEAEDATPSQSTDIPAAAPEPVAPQMPVETGEAGNSMRRADFEKAMRLRVDQDEVFSLTTVWLRNLGQLFTEFPSEAVIEMMAQAASKLEQALKGNPLWSRWEDDCFVLYSDQPKASAAKAAQELASALSIVYSVQHNGQTFEPKLHVTVGVIERGRAEPLDRLFARTTQLIRSLRSAA